ncbi:hypothetical protein D9M71_797610 [compost metagenome]
MATVRWAHVNATQPVQPLGAFGTFVEFELRGGNGHVVVRGHQQHGQLVVVQEHFQPLLFVFQRPAGYPVAPGVEIPACNNGQQVRGMAQGQKRHRGTPCTARRYFP